MLIYAAEDDVDDRDWLRREFIKPKDWRLQLFKSGRELLTALKHGKQPDCLLLDMSMPEVDGFEVMAFWHENGLGHIPIYVMSSSQGHEEILRERGCHPTAFLRKPVSQQEFAKLWTQRPAV